MAAELKRCSNANVKKGWRCKHEFSVSDPRKWCPNCRGNATKNYRKNNVSRRASQKKYESKPERKARVKEWKDEYAATEEGAAAMKASHTKYNKKPIAKVNRKKYLKTEKGRASTKRSNQSFLRKLQISLIDMMKGRHPNPVSMPSLGCFKDNADVRDHLGSTMDKSWMTWKNHGQHVEGNAYNVLWNIGHRLPRALFDPNNLSDLAKCFDRRNLYAQCARHNIESNRRLVLSNDELLQLKDIWPSRAEGDLEKLKGLFRA